MSRVSQELARHCTKILLEKKRVEMEKMQVDYRKEVQENYLKTVPKEVIAFDKKVPGFINKTWHLKLNGNGFNHETVSMPTLTPGIENAGYVYYEPEKEVAVLLKNLHNKAKDAEQRFKAVKEETYNALLSLGTAKKVAEAFPELAVHVDQPIVGVIVDVSGLKKKINALP